VRNLILLIKQFHSFFIFLLLELVCLIIVFKNNNYQQSSYINSSRNVSGTFYSQKAKLTGFINLTEVNDSLMKENAALRKELGITMDVNPLKDSTFSKQIHVDSSLQTAHYTYIPAKVLNNTIDQTINYITLNVGSKQGIKKNMAVISANGIVGRISHVSENYSVALSFLSDRFNVSSMVSDGTVGKLSWDGKDPDYGILSGIPQSVKLKPRDSVFTSGFGNFPEKILVGKAAQVLNGTSYKIYLSTNFRKLHFVYVIAEEIDLERKKIEDSTQVN
jgi:rod shape-determining protein MreC